LAKEALPSLVHPVPPLSEHFPHSMEMTAPFCWSWKHLLFTIFSPGLNTYLVLYKIFVERMMNELLKAIQIFLMA
jgi:hypothetical protein